MNKNIAASIRARLLNLAKTEGSDFNHMLVRYALERLLYRLSQSKHANHFLLKGALLFTLWYDMPHRPTRDADLLGFGPVELDIIKQTFREICSITVDDGIRFNPDSIGVTEIRKEAGYGGARVIISAELARARCKTQIDIGFGDAVTPGSVQATYPVLIQELPAPKLRTYPIYTVLAEKLHAIVLLGMTNSRLKDYFDLSVLINREKIEQDILTHAIKATFQRRDTEIPKGIPTGLTDEFANDASRQALWKTFLKKNELQPSVLTDVVASLRTNLQPALEQAAREEE